MEHVLSVATLRALSRAIAADHVRHHGLASARARGTDRDQTERALAALASVAWIDGTCFPMDKPIAQLGRRLRAHLASLDRQEAAAARPRGAEARWPAVDAAVDAAIARGDAPITVARAAIEGLVRAGLLTARTADRQHVAARRLLDARKKRQGVKRKKR